MGANGTVVEVGMANKRCQYLGYNASMAPAWLGTVDVATMLMGFLLTKVADDGDQSSGTAAAVGLTTLRSKNRMINCVQGLANSANASNA
jgi:hypothetical protein